MKTETFPDGSTIETDEATGNRTVFGAMAHREYFKWEVWHDIDPANVIRCKSEESARKHFKAACLHGTNGMGGRMTFAKNSAEFTGALFTGPRTFDGFIVRKLKRGIKLWAMGENYVLNEDGVFCLATKLNGETWYSYGGRLNAALNMTQREELAESIRAMA